MIGRCNATTIVIATTPPGRRQAAEGPDVCLQQEVVMMQSGSSCRQADDEAGAGRRALRRAPVLGPDDAAMRLDDLLRYRPADAGMGAEFLARRPLAIEAIEDGGDVALGDAGPSILDGDDHRALIALHGEGDGAA